MVGVATDASSSLSPGQCVAKAAMTACCSFPGDGCCWYWRWWGGVGTVEEGSTTGQGGSTSTWFSWGLFKLPHVASSAVGGETVIALLLLLLLLSARVRLSGGGTRGRFTAGAFRFISFAAGVMLLLLLL